MIKHEHDDIWKSYWAVPSGGEIWKMISSSRFRPFRRDKAAMVDATQYWFAPLLMATTMATLMNKQADLQICHPTSGHEAIQLATAFSFRQKIM